jgi:hypothetical protein
MEGSRRKEEESEDGGGSQRRIVVIVFESCDRHVIGRDEESTIITGVLEKSGPNAGDAR